MSEETIINEYLELCDVIQNSEETGIKFNKLAEWIRKHLGVSQVVISRFTRVNSNYYGIWEANSVGKNGKRGLIEREPTISLKKRREINPPNKAKTLSYDELELVNVNIENPEIRVTYVPALSERGIPLGAIFIIDEKAEAILKSHQLTLKLLAFKLAELLISDTNEADLENFSPKEKHLRDFFLLVEKFPLPVYVTDIEGNFLYISPSFTKLTGYASPVEIKILGKLFDDPEERKREIEIILKKGSITNYHLRIISKFGEKKEIYDTAALIEGQIWGIFFDITDFVRQKKELSDTLEMQEFLNDQIFKTVNLLQKTQIAAIKTLAKLAEFRDRETGNHLIRMSEYASTLAEEVYKRDPYSFKISKEYQNDIYLSSMLHDIGKVGVPDSILLKPGKLEEHEWEIMKKHTIWGWEILNEADKELGEQSFLTLASIIAFHHHEKYDGTGYPTGLKGEKIPLSARITTIGDVYDALTSKRPYKEPWPHEKAVEEFKNQRGKHFDPILVDIFLEIENNFAKIRKKFSD